ncbi:hypothetical protein EDB86DRAFT_2897366 [Lactarius hatsudake]|nr:hypothetical protein EDB86DRAFT_2897366 [Lactarius hatsudake]
MQEFMHSYGLKMWDDDDVQEAKAILDGFRKIDAAAAEGDKVNSERSATWKIKVVPQKSSQSKIGRRRSGEILVLATMWIYIYRVRKEYWTSSKLDAESAIARRFSLLVSSGQPAINKLHGRAEHLPTALSGRGAHCLISHRKRRPSHLPA